MNKKSTKIVYMSIIQIIEFMVKFSKFDLAINWTLKTINK